MKKYCELFFEHVGKLYDKEDTTRCIRSNVYIWLFNGQIMPWTGSLVSDMGKKGSVPSSKSRQI